MSKVRRMLDVVFLRRKAPAVSVPVQHCEEHYEARKKHTEELAARAHAVARRVHILEFLTMPDFVKISEIAAKRRQQRREGEKPDGERSDS